MPPPGGSGAMALHPPVWSRRTLCGGGVKRQVRFRHWPVPSAWQGTVASRFVHHFLLVHMVKCYLTESERARVAMCVAMGVPVERCGVILGVRWGTRCLLPLGHSGACAQSHSPCGCKHDTKDCPTQGRRPGVTWKTSEPWCIGQPRL